MQFHNLSILAFHLHRMTIIVLECCLVPTVIQFSTKTSRPGKRTIIGLVTNKDTSPRSVFKHDIYALVYKNATSSILKKLILPKFGNKLKKLSKLSLTASCI